MAIDRDRFCLAFLYPNREEWTLSSMRSLSLKMLILACLASAGCGIEYINWLWAPIPSVTRWEVEQGAERIIVFEPSFDTPTVLGFRVLLAPDRPNELLVDTNLFDYWARDSDGTMRDERATRLNLGTRRADRVPAEWVVALRGDRDLKAIENPNSRARPSLRTAGELPFPRLAQTRWLARQHAGKRYVAAVAYSEVSSFERSELNFALLILIPTGVDDVTYFSAVTHLELFDESRPDEPLVSLSRKVGNQKELIPDTSSFATWTT